MNDNEIIKALECCRNGLCTDCPRLNTPAHILLCKEQLMCEALDLIKRQMDKNKAYRHYYDECLKDLKKANAEIERLKSPCEMQIEVSKKLEATIKAEAVKEFADRLKADIVETGDEHGIGNKYPVLTYNYIDNLVKEMVGEG